eukprot:503586_1
MDINKLIQYQSYGTLDNKLVSGYIRIISNDLMMYIPVEIIEICSIFYAKYGNLICFIGSYGIKLLDVNNSKKFKMKLNFEVPPKYVGGCVANNIKLQKNVVSSLSNDTNYDAMFLINLTNTARGDDVDYDKQCKLIFYDPLQFNNTQYWSKDVNNIGVDGYEVKLPVLKGKKISNFWELSLELKEKITPIYDSKNKSFYVSNLNNICSLNIDANSNVMDWIQLVDDNKLIKRLSVSLLYENNNFYRIGGVNSANVKYIEMYCLESKNVKRLPDIP